MGRHSVDRLCLASVALLMMLTAGCTSQPVDVVEPEVEAPAADATSSEKAVEMPATGTVSGQGVELVASSLDPAMALAPEETVEVAVGQAIEVAEPGWAELTWPADASTDEPVVSVKLLSGAELKLAEADGAETRVTFEQSDGAARYWVAPQDPPARASVQAGPLTVVADQGATDFVVFFQPAMADEVAEAPTSGQAPEAEGAAGADDDQVGRGDADAAAGGEPAGVAYAAEEPSGDLVWVVVASGDTEVQGCRRPGDVSSAQACVVADGRAASFTSKGELVDTETLRPSMLETWYAQLVTGAPVNPLVVHRAAQPVEEEAEPVDQPTAELSPAVGEFTADKATIAPGSCTLLRWSVTGASSVLLDDVEVEATGNREVCPAGTTTYRLVWVGPDGEQEAAEIVVTVNDPGGDRNREEDDDEDEDDRAPAPDPTATECIGPECGEPTPPWEFPTAPPLPTDPPAEPTDPAPEPTDPPPEPTDPPPEPTDPPAEPTDPPPEPTEPSEPEPTP